MNEIQRKRLEKQILRYIAELYFRELKNPNIGYVTFTRCELSKDLRQARVFVSIPGEEISGAPVENASSREKSLEALKKTSKFIKGKIGRLLRLKQVPEIFFLLDNSLEEAFKMDQLLQENSGENLNTNKE